ncbi:hypothetical protein [Nonomuraea sp. NPDC048826]|uniref:hypothetical protein n=1 Tax=Nonomuraea sp. NPDC048826 TaxID=3364347 RepID=UPI00371F0AF2
MRHLRKTTAVLAAAGAIAATSAVNTPAAQATVNTLSCVSPPSSGPNLDGGWGVMKGTYNLKQGASIKTCNVKRMRRGQVLYFNCWKRNSHGNLWVFGRIKGTRTYGWMSAANFSSVHRTGYPACDSERA